MSNPLNALHADERVPLVVPLDVFVEPDRIFRAFHDLPGRIWLDSVCDAHRGADHDGAGDSGGALSRFSFLSADPVYRLTAFPGQPDPWPELERLAGRLPTAALSDLPPFQGGIAGVIGYEAGRWLEPIELAACHQQQIDDLPTPAMSLGIYDWTIAIDHWSRTQWLISQGFNRDDLLGDAYVDPARLRERACRRASEVLKRLATCQSLPPVRCEVQPHADAALDRHVVSNFTSQQFRDAVASIIQRIHAGDSFQVNLAQRLVTEQRLDSETLYLRLRQANAAPFAGFYDGDSFQVLSSSPEGFLQVRDRHVMTRPIKGTTARHGEHQLDRQLADDLSASAKDRAENIMIVDLMRNDLSRVCTDASVRVSQLCEVEPYRYVQHLVSAVEGDLRHDVGVVDLLRACFPGGSVTGAPKIEAMKTIAELESHPRGPYCGSMGYISCGGDADFNILIRTMTATRGKLQIPVGGGITAQSDPAAEEAETWAKAKGMLKALPADPSNAPSRRPTTSPSTGPSPTLGRQVV